MRRLETLPGPDDQQDTQPITDRLRGCGSLPGMTGREQVGLTVGDVLRLPGLQAGRLLAGSKGIDRPVDRMNMMEVPDVMPWVRPRELLVTSGYPLSEYDVTGLEDLVSGLYTKGVGGLVAKVGGRYLRELPPPVLRRADKIGLPLIQMPLDLAFTDLQEQFYRQVLSLHEKRLVAAAADRQRADRIRRLLESRVVDPGLLAEWAVEANITLLAKRAVVVRGRAALGVDSYRRLTEKMSHVPRMTEWMLQAFGDCVIALVPAADDSEVAEDLRALMKDSPGVRAGVGGLAPTPAEWPRSYRQALRAIEVAERPATAAPVVSWSRLGLHRVVDALVSADMASELVAAALGPVQDEPQLRETLETFLRYNCNVAETARAMHFHYNTVRQRVARLELTLGPFVNDAERRTELLIACEVERQRRT